MRLIDADDLKKWLERWKGYLDDDMIQRMQICSKDIPTIEEWKKGKWIPFLEEYHDMFKCSNCGNITRVPFKCPSPPYYYCPNCGADMREEKTDETN